MVLSSVVLMWFIILLNLFWLNCSCTWDESCLIIANNLFDVVSEFFKKMLMSGFTCFYFSVFKKRVLRLKQGVHVRIPYILEAVYPFRTHNHNHRVLRYSVLETYSQSILLSLREFHPILLSRSQLIVWLHLWVPTAFVFKPMLWDISANVSAQFLHVFSWNDIYICSFSGSACFSWFIHRLGLSS